MNRMVPKSISYSAGVNQGDGDIPFLPIWKFSGPNDQSAGRACFNRTSMRFGAKLASEISNSIDREVPKHINISSSISLPAPSYHIDHRLRTMSSPPAFYSKLCTSGPIACITPGTTQANKGYAPDLASQIADGLFHPAIEVGLHLLNGDLYSAHFLARKMQNDQYG